MDMADRNGEDFVRSLFSAECFNDAAMAPGSEDSKIFSSRSSALLVAVTVADHFLTAFLELMFCFLLSAFSFYFLIKISGERRKYKDTTIQLSPNHALHTVLINWSEIYPNYSRSFAGPTERALIASQFNRNFLTIYKRAI
jgi:hypothetical protein